MCDVTQIWILGERRARLWTIIAGIWVDLILCFFATLIWWTTAPGMWTHDFAYKVIMVTGVGVTLANLNPLIKLDGYYMFSEITGEADLKERSTLYVSGWVKRHIFGLPVEIEYVPRRRRLFYITYSALSGVYSYGLIAVVVLFLYNVVRSYSPEYAWIAGLLIGLAFFRSRIRRFIRFMKDVYLDKKDRVRAWFTPARAVVCSCVAVVVLFTPVWPDFVSGQFVLEPAQRAVIRADVPGKVEQVLVAENQSVSAGTPLLRLRNLQLESEAAQTNAKLREASARAVQAGLRYSDFGRAEREREEQAERNRILQTELEHLQITSPIAGVVVTPRLQDLVGSYVPAGTQVAEVADMRTMRARIYIPEYGVRDVRVGTRARLQVPGRLFPVSAKLDSMAPLFADIDPAFAEKEQLSGIVPPPYYVGFVTLNNDGTLWEGASGDAKLFVRRRSLAAFMGRFGSDLFERRFW
jgi:putative peptide zinc metalloprotease protein